MHTLLIQYLFLCPLFDGRYSIVVSVLISCTKRTNKLLVGKTEDVQLFVMLMTDVLLKSSGINHLVRFTRVNMFMMFKMSAPELNPLQFLYHFRQNGVFT